MRPLNYEKDNLIDVPHIQEEFREFPSTLFAWCEAKADVEGAYDLAKVVYEESRSQAYVEIKQSGDKVTESHIDALIETNPIVMQKKRNLLQSKRDLETLKSYVESLRAKKDFLIQLGADLRKEK